jgi:hypothetical protein
VSAPSTCHREAIPAGWLDELDAAAVLAGQGIDASSRAARLPALHAAAGRALAEGRGLLAPALASRLLQVERSTLDEVLLAGGSTIASASVAKRLSGSLQVVLVACTIGRATDRRAADLMRDDPAAALAFDGLGTAAVNALASGICRDLRFDASRSGQRTTAPLSPGQGEWDLATGQRMLFALVRPERIGLALSDGGQMQPCKSLSFAIGVGPTVDDRGPGACAGCSSQPGCRWGRLRRE